MTEAMASTLVLSYLNDMARIPFSLLKILTSFIIYDSFIVNNNEKFMLHQIFLKNLEKTAKKCFNNVQDIRFLSKKQYKFDFYYYIC
jgi:hypothetical protein